MAERDARIVAVDAGRVSLRTDASACRDCRIGCGGRCNLFRPDAAGAITLSLPEGMHLAEGDHVRLWIDEVALRRAAFAGYGMALLGLVAGAVAGFALAAATGLPRDPATLLGLVAGTAWMLRRSRRHDIQPRLEKRHDGPYQEHSISTPLQSKPRP